MRLLFVTQDFAPSVGGIQTYCRELAHRLAPACHDLAVLAPAAPGAAAIDPTLPYRVHRLRIGSERSAMAAACTLAIPALCRSGRYDVVFHAQWNTAHGSTIARRFGLVDRVVAAAHGRELLIDLPPVRLYHRWRRALLRRIDRFVAVSRYTGGLLERSGVEPSRIAVVPNGVDPRRFSPADGGAFRARHGLVGMPLLLTLCRLVPRKGIDTVLRALPSVKERVPDVRYVIAGDGHDRGRLETLAARLRVRDRVHFVGAIDDADVAGCLSAADVFVMPARSRPPDVEGFGLVFLEANACGRPVVGADAGGVPDAIVPGVTGELVPPDDPAALAGTLVYLLEDRTYAARLGRQGRERVERELDWDHAAATLLRVLDGTA